jgi:SAM-dependent methyltransferase
MAAFGKEISSSERILEVAPTASVTRLLKASSDGLYVGIDLDPSADGRKVQVVADLCAAPFVDGAFKTSVCFHVFEHIPDDISAMAEYARLLSPIGVGFIQNPWKPQGTTVEDPTASPEERLQRFGQADHVRTYGADFEDRLRSVGLEPRRVVPDQFLDERTMNAMSITPHMPIWMVFGSSSRYGGMSAARFDKVLRRRLERSLRELDWPGGRLHRT